MHFSSYSKLQWRVHNPGTEIWGRSQEIQLDRSASGWLSTLHSAHTFPNPCYNHEDEIFVRTYCQLMPVLLRHRRKCNSIPRILPTIAFNLRGFARDGVVILEEIKLEEKPTRFRGRMTAYSRETLANGVPTAEKPNEKWEGDAGA
jgi:hypothetical protein